MNARFPFFYYDIIARIIPGALLLVVLWVLGVEMPAIFLRPDTVVPGEGALDGGSQVNYGLWQPVILSAVYLGACYVIGVLCEVVYLTPGLEKVYNRGFIDGAFLSAASTFSWRREVDRAELPNPSPVWSLTDIRIHANNWLMLCPRDGRDNAYTHSHRFQAESKLLQHSAIVGLALACGAAWRGLEDTWDGHDVAVGMLTGAMLAVFGVLLGRMRERRRWQAVLAALDEIHSDDDNGDLMLQAACEDLHRKTP